MISKLPSDLQDRLLRDYFSPDGGVNYNLCRVPIGATDASTRPYTLDDTHNEDDETLKSFALQPEDDQRVNDNLFKYMCHSLGDYDQDHD